MREHASLLRKTSICVEQSILKHPLVSSGYQGAVSLHGRPQCLQQFFFGYQP
jgi:hypothetical protein